MPHATNSACLCFFIMISVTAFVWFKTGLSTLLHGCPICQAYESCTVVCQPDFFFLAGFLIKGRDSSETAVEGFLSGQWIQTLKCRKSEMEGHLKLRLLIIILYFGILLHVALLFTLKYSLSCKLSLLKW
jgi:hypothetical protein